MKQHKRSIGYRSTILAIIFVVGGTSTNAQQRQGHTPVKPHDDKVAAPCPMMQSEQANRSAKDGHAGHLAAVNARGEHAMGFSLTQTTHHFHLRPDGGVIQVEVNDATDTANREQIRQHLAHIAEMFAAGDFQTPMLVHEQIPPGVPEMKRLRAAIKFVYEETERGGRVHIVTADTHALAAVHAFLRFQIKDHQTGDSLIVSK